MGTPPPPGRLFPPEPGVELRNKGERARRVLTAGGEVELRRRYYWAPGRTGVYPVDQAAGLGAGASPGAREIVCRLGLVENFAAAAADARRIGNVPARKERLRLLVEAEAHAVRQAREAGALPAAWTAAEAQTVPGGPTRVYHGTDGVMVPTVTQAEKDQRRRARQRTGVARPLAGGGAGHG